MKAVLSVAASAWLTLAAVPAAAAPFTALYSFGDSLSDSGNVFLSTGGAIPAPPYAAGRFSNGPNWVDDVSAGLHLGPSVPVLAGGTNYAFGGAVTGPAIPGGSTAVPNILQQVGLFSFNTGGVAPASALYTVWIGANDVFAAVADLVSATLTFAQAQAAVALAAQTEALAIGALAAEGAQTFIVPLVPDLGKTPTVTDVPPLEPLATALAQTYNATLLAAVAALAATDGITVHVVDTFTLIDNAVANPAAFGFTNVTDRCYVGPLTGGGSVCATPGTYLFWDGEHPTAAGYAQVARLALAAIPEPASLLLLLPAALGLALRRRHR